MSASQDSKGGHGKRLAVGLAFLAPNILGFFVFTLIPLVFALVMAFTNWDLRRHNSFRAEQLEFLGVANFTRLFMESGFWRYLGNTLFLMMGIPFSIAGSLVLALLLSRKTKEMENPRIGVIVIGAAVIVGAAIVLVALGAGASGTAILLSCIAGVVLLSGVTAGPTLYRTLFYLPAFTSGVATILLWKNLFNPTTGPVNGALAPILRGVERVAIGSPGWVFGAVSWLLALTAVGLLLMSLQRMRRLWIDGEIGSRASILPRILLMLPFVVVWLKSSASPVTIVGLLAAVLMLSYTPLLLSKREFTCKPAEGSGSALMAAVFTMVAEFVLLALALIAWHLPAMAKEGLAPPGWHTDYHWAKPAIMIISFWAAIGSNNMLLFLAGLSGIPQELYEAADLDGTSPLQRFWNVTWPQLAPTTFFIVVMSVIGGLQGGFEIARTMTLGGPDGATTTLSHFIYQEGFETGRLGYASAVAWTLFLLVLGVTLFNWKFGNRYVND